MFVKKLVNCNQFTANDSCKIRELLHPKNDPVELPYSIALATVEQNQRSTPHKLEQDEVYYILQGFGHMHIDDETSIVKTGDIIFIPAFSVQWIENNADIDLNFLAIVSPPWTAEGDVRIV